MKLLATTQGSALRLMLTLSKALQEKTPHELALVISDSSEYLSVKADKEQSKRLSICNALCEWELFERSRSHQALEKDYLAIEQEIKEPLMWTALADRRLMFGKYCKRTQDYKPVLSEDRMKQVVAYGYKVIEQFFRKEKPDVILSFGMATYCDYISAKLARKLDIPYFIFKSAKMGNCVSLNDDPYEWPTRIWDKFNETPHLLEAGAMKLDCIKQAHEAIEDIHKSGIVYEGALDFTSSFRSFSPIKALKTVAKGAALELTRRRREPVRSDHHLDGYFVPAIYEQVVQPWRAWRQSKFLQKHIISPDELSGGKRRIFYPLHFEPEVSLQIYGRPYQNQIEVIRSLALSSPADTEILVKEHPRSLGFRSLSYYKKLLEIPKVRLLPPLLPSTKAVSLCHAVAVISGTIGLEAAILGKPVLVLGRPAYRHVGEPHFFEHTDPWTLHRTLEKILDLSTADAIRLQGEERFTRLLSIIFEESCAVDLYTVFLGKPGRRTANMFGEQMSRNKQIEALINYFSERLSEIKPQAVTEQVA